MAKVARRTARTQPPRGASAQRPEPESTQIDARQFQDAKGDPVVKRFAQYADETVETLRREKRLR